jgi:hypothetical protein
MHDETLKPHRQTIDTRCVGISSQVAESRLFKIAHFGRRHERCDQHPQAGIPLSAA